MALPPALYLALTITIILPALCKRLDGQFVGTRVGF